jgi:hypothetical protein
MPIPNNPLVVKVAMIYRMDTRHFVNTLHVHNSLGWDLSGMEDLAVAIKAWWNDTYQNIISNQVGLEQIQVRLLDPSNPLAVDYSDGLPTYGDQTSVHEPANVTSTISWRTGLAGRKYRGRIYIPPITEASTNADDTIGSTTVTALAAAASDLLTKLATAALELVVFHGETSTFTKVITFVIENILDSQRRRLPGRGR